jgi:hypothetical protein
MKKLTIVGVGFLGLVLACGEDKKPTFVQPAGTVAVNFTVDDSANKVFTAGQLKWKGSMIYDPATNLVTYDGTWSGGTTGQEWAVLYDDGSWKAGGHEPEGSKAGDNKWGVTVFATPPATGSQTYEYGLIDVVYETDFGNGWIWTGANGQFLVNAGATAEINAPGITLPQFGTIDMKLVIDSNNLAAGTWNTSKVTVKGSATAWSEVTLTNDGSGKFPFLLSNVVGAGKTFIHSGLLKTGDKPEFIFVFNGVEYKTSGTANTTGVTAFTGPSGNPTTAATVLINATNNNTYILIP